MPAAKFPDAMKLDSCRVCRGKNLETFLVLGPQPLSNNFLKKEQLGGPEPFYPLDVCFCPACHMVQLTHVVPPEVMFSEYAYITSSSRTMPIHLAELAGDVTRRFGLDGKSLAVDIGSNDGSMVLGFQKLGVRGLGIEPASNVAAIARQRGVETVNDFWCERTARQVRKEKGPAGAILGTNVFAHCHDLDDFLRGVKHLLGPGGAFVIEVPYLVDLLQHTEFDTIYHEHLSYFAVGPLQALFRRFDMSLVDVKRDPIHGGSIRVFARPEPNLPPSEEVQRLLRLEKENRLDSIETYRRFARDVASIRDRLVPLLRDLKKQGKVISGYGAPAKGNTLLNYCKIGTDLLDFATDTTPFKQNHYTPGMHIPVHPDTRFKENPPDYSLLLAWNFAEEILKKEKAYMERGGKFIVPVPHPKIIP
ncbi:MAG: methyltransferase domain-containing protein [Euryarchaeota archaeon]|nr:methyltransferase domain-containing protein [Euryarchaeota archaeon]